MMARRFKHSWVKVAVLATVLAVTTLWREFGPDQSQATSAASKSFIYTKHARCRNVHVVLLIKKKFKM